MYKTNFGNLSLLQFDIFRKENQIRHGITTKEGWRTGCKPRFTELNNCEYNSYRNELSSAMGITPENIYFPKQVHSDSVLVVTEHTSHEDLGENDAIITNQKDICLAIQTADCVPVIMFDPQKKVVAAVHAGWRGTVNKLVLKTIQKMVEDFGCRPENMLAGIGPSINKYAYEVGEDVIVRVINSFKNSQSILIPSINEGKAFFDLWEANKTLLIEAGLQCENIEILGLCTYELNDLFFSARRDGLDTGRNVSYIMLN